MPFTNFDSRHFTDSERNTVNDLLNSLEIELTSKVANLTAEERQQYGSVNEQNKLIINKVRDYHESQPNLASPDVDWEEFNNDFATREFLQKTIQRLQSMIDGCNNAKILHDWDNYQAALTDYDFSKYKAGTQSSGFNVKVSEMGQFFAGRPTGSSETKKTETPPAE